MTIKHSRRDILKGGMLTASFVGFSQLFGYNRLFAQSDGDTLENILNLAATAEMLACTHYYTALTDSDIELIPSARNFLIAALDTEFKHLEFLMANKGQPVATSFYTPRNVYNDRGTFSSVTQQAESAFVAAYLAANRRVAELGNSKLAATVAQIAVTESVHLALIRQLGGLLPNNISLGEALYYSPSEVLPVLQPFLEGGSDFAGPLSYPGNDAITNFVGKNGVIDVRPFIDVQTTGGVAS